MTFAGINYITVIIAALAGFGFGAFWYMTLSKPWMQAAGISREAMERRQREGGRFHMYAPFITSAIALLIMAWSLAGILGHLGTVDIRNGVISGFFLWLGFVATTMAVNHRVQNLPWALTFIDTGHWLGVLVLQGVIIGAFGV